MRKRSGRSGLETKYRPKATRSASPDATIASAAAKSSRGYDRALELGSDMFGRDRLGAFLERLVSLDARLDHMEVGEPEAVHLLRDIAESLFRIAIVHVAITAARRETHADPIAAPNGHRRLSDP